MKIGGLQKLTLIDFPGKIAATIFISGCSFRCPWCHSPELVLPEKIKKHPKISEKYLFDFLKERKGLLEGVCLTGGEPTLNKNLPEFIKKIKKIGFLVKLDTNGSNPEMLKKLIDKKLIDYLAMDVKAPLTQNSKFKTQNYEKVTGVKIDLEKIKESIEIIKNSGLEYEFRLTVVPGLHSKKDIIQIAKDISPAKAFYLQNFRPKKNIDPKFEKIKPYSEDFLKEIQKKISSYFEICQIR